ncbi:integrase core domain-containing protein [Nonomuraea sp. NPDC003709]|uniref:integrase core domain-containing protein n=1 Tax=Nonomuraea sp. NPDC003709 TaxID=3154450 RepID=UPI0033AC145C
MDEIQTVLTGIRMPRMSAIMERWVQSCRHELLDRCLLWNERHLQHALREYEQFYNRHRAHQALAQAAPLRPVRQAQGPVRWQLVRVAAHRVRGGAR